MNGSAVKAHTISPGRPGAPLVLFAHGMEGHWKSWTPLAAHLDQGYRVVSLELPWKAGNDFRWRNRSFGEWLGDGLDMVGATPDVLVAHSFGANAALDLMCRLDPRVGSSVALFCPFYRLPRFEVTWRMFERSRETFTAHVGEGVRARLGKRAATLDPEVVDGMVKIALNRAGPLGFAAVFDRYAASADLQLGNVEIPTKVLVGGMDPTLPAESARALADGMPGATLHTLDRGDHFFHVRYARYAAAEVTGLVEDVRTIPKVGELR